MGILALLAVLAIGALLGWVLRKSLALASLNRALTRFSVWALLAVMGAKLAEQRTLFMGNAKAFAAALGSSLALTIVFFLAFWLIGLIGLGKKRAPARTPQEGSAPKGTLHELVSVAVNGGCIFVGFLLCWLQPEGLTAHFSIDHLADWVLRALLLFIGFDLGAELHRLDLRRLPPILLLAPALNIALSLAVGLAFGWMSGIGAREGSLMAAGLGWYSLSSVLLAERGLMLVSVMAFIHNVFRELLAILCAPLAAKVSPLLPVYLGGATSMDVMLPFVQRYSGADYTLLSFYSGAACSIAVMPLVKLIAM